MRTIIVLWLLLIAVTSVVLAADNCIGISDLDEKVTCYERKIQENQGRQKTLAGTIAYLDNKTKLTLSQIEKTETDIKTLEEEVNVLTVKISNLDINLSDVSRLLIARVGEAYKRHSVNPTLHLLTAGGLTDFLERAKYLKAAQQNDQKLLLEMQQSRNLSQQQKELKEQKQTDLENLKKQLATQNASLLQQKSVKTNLLDQTKNDEQRYQQLLTIAKAEYLAIQDIIAHKGKETAAGHVDAGDKIASIIQGASCNSKGTHVHFIVSENGAAKNPFDWLSGSVDWVDNSDGDQFNPHGNWTWPIKSRVKFNQGYGVTSFVQTYHWYPFHNGIDINSESANTVMAVKPGTLYKGSYIGWNGCTLPYVRVDHDENSLETLYLHVIY